MAVAHRRRLTGDRDLDGAAEAFSRMCGGHSPSSHAAVCVVGAPAGQLPPFTVGCFFPTCFRNVSAMRQTRFKGGRNVPGFASAATRSTAGLREKSIATGRRIH
jgi:hypothetical protein